MSSWLESNGTGRLKPYLNGVFMNNSEQKEAIFLRFQTAQPFRIALKWRALFNLRGTSDCNTVEPKLRLS